WRCGKCLDGQKEKMSSDTKQCLRLYIEIDCCLLFSLLVELFGHGFYADFTMATRITIPRA
ncbi:unnamed protein product, partial [Brassica rapa subsp. narinosa]